ncbi:MAG: type II secretion system protein [Thermodesulfobacteriota bacterium]
MKTGRPVKASGFTLLEVIVTLIVAGLLAAMIFNLLSSHAADSTRPVQMARDNLTLYQVMENMTGDYKARLAQGSLASPFSIQDFKTRVENGNNNGNDPYYGDYTVQAGYVSVDNATGTVTASAGPTRFLKVTISRDGQSLTAIFTE